MNAAAERIIAALRLEPLPHEGGYFRVTWRSEAGSAILFLITREHFSALHRLAQDELWHFHAGDPVEHVQFGPSAGGACVTRLGSDVLAGEQPQVAVPRGAWQGARLAPASRGVNAGEGNAAAGEHGFALLGCTVTPPWDERGFELGERAALLRQFPAEVERIVALTR